MRTSFWIDSENRSAFTLFILSLLNYFLQFLFTSYLTHHLSPRLYGDFYLSLSLLSITANLSLLGTHTTAIKFLPSYLHSDNTSVLENFLSWLFKIIIISFVTCLMLSFLFAALLFFFHALGIKELNSYDLVIFTLWITPFAAFALLLQKFILSNNHPVVSYVLQKDFTYLLQLILFILVISILEIKLNNLSFSLVLILSYIFMIIIALFFIKNHNTKLFSFLKRHTFTQHQICSQWKKMSFKVIVAGLIYLILSSLDLFILKIITPHKSQVGMYSVVWVVCNLLTIVPGSIYTLLLPKIDLYTRKDPNYPLHSFQKTLNKINSAVSIFIFAFSLIGIIFGKEILVLFSPEYASVYKVLVICIFTTIITALSLSAANLLLYSGNINTLLKIDLLNLVLTLLLGISLTYLYNIIGISVACLIVQSIIMVLLIYYARRKTGVKSITIF